LANSTKNNSSSASSNPKMKRSMADRAAAIFSGVMLPLASSTMPRLTGIRSLLKKAISCARPFS